MSLAAVKRLTELINILKFKRQKFMDEDILVMLVAISTAGYQFY